MAHTMNLNVAIPPYAEPIHLDDMKNHLKVELSSTEDDELIATQITAARGLAEASTGANRNRSKVMVATTFDYSFDCFDETTIKLPRVPLISVTSITYVDTAGDSQTLATTVYTVDTAGGCVHLAYNQAWPSTRYQPNAVTIRFIAGMAAPFTVVAGTDVVTAAGRSLTEGERVRLFNSGGQLPTPLKVDTDYFVIAGPKLSLTSGGSAVDITGVGSGTHFLGLELSGFQALRASTKLRCGHWYDNREALVITGAVPQPLPMAVEALELGELA